jgi:hypothetical protein
MSRKIGAAEGSVGCGKDGDMQQNFSGWERQRDSREASRPILVAIEREFAEGLRGRGGRDAGIMRAALFIGKMDAGWRRSPSGVIPRPGS